MLAEMADEYVNTEDKTQFAEKAIAVFGKQYATLIPLFSQGGQKLREATDAVADNLVVTNKEIDASREYEIAVDNLGDAWTGVKNEIGNAVIPVLTKLLNTINENKEASENIMDTADGLENAFHAGMMTETEYVKVRHDLMTGTMSLADAQEWLAEKNKDVFDAATMAYPEEERFLVLFEAFPPVISATTDAMLTNEEAMAAEAAAAAAADQAMSALYDSINGRLGPEIKDFTNAQTDLELEMHGVQDRILELNKMEHLTPEQQSEIDGLQQEYTTLEEQYTANADAHEEATKRILFDILTQAAAMDGLTSTEVRMLAGVALNWGIVDQATVDATDQAVAAFDYYNKSGDIQGAMALIYELGDSFGAVATKAGGADDAVRAIGQHAAEIEGDYDINFNVTVTGDPIPTIQPGGKPVGFSKGTDMIVPPNFENDSFPFYAESGERVIVIPKDQQQANQFNNTFTMNVHTNAGISTAYRDYNIMKAKAG